MEKVVLGLSGGVDSAVAARLLQEQGCEVCGLYMDIAGDEARADAQRVAEELGVSLVVADVAAAQEEFVRRPFVDAYLRGETPNPCILCNPAVKFKTLLDYADTIGAQTVATSSNKDFLVVANSSATEPTLVKINPAHHWNAGTAIA